MRYVAILLVLLSIPLFISLLKQNPHRRAWAFTAIGLMMFLGDTWRIDASLIGWPMWNGIVRGMEFSPIDTLALALVVTRQSRLSVRPFWIVFGIYGAALALSMLPASVWMATFFAWWQYARVLLLFAAIAGECDRPDLRGGLLRGWACGLLFQAYYVILQKLSGVVQATGTMYHQNALGMMTELALVPLIAALFAGDRSKLTKAGIAAGMIVIVGGGSRGAMGIAGGGIALFALLSLARGVTPVKLKMVGLGALALVVVVPLGMMTLKDRFGDTSVTAQEAQRAAFERAARAMAADYPLGAGANLYVPTANLKGYADNAGVAWNFANRSAPVHNAYLLARAETGWGGEIGFALLLFVPIILGLRAAFAERRGATGEMALGSALAVGVNLVHNNYEYAVFVYSVLSLVFVNLGLIAAQVRGVQRARMGRRARRPAPVEPEQVPVLA